MSRKSAGVGTFDVKYDKSPLYTKWINMLQRCYDVGTKDKNKSYIDCVCCDDWLTYSVFKAWAGVLYHKGLDLDKDIILMGNKVYCPDYCSFIPRYVNISCITRPQYRGDLPLGVTLVEKDYKLKNPYISQISSLGKRVYLGYFNNPYDAHKAWKVAKIASLKQVIDKYRGEGCYDPRVEGGLVSRINMIQECIKREEEVSSL